MGGALWRFWQQRSHLQEGREVLAGLLARPTASAPTAARAKALEGLGGAAYWQGDFASAEQAYSEELAVAQGLGDRRLVAEALYNLGFVKHVLGRRDEGRSMHEQAMAVFEELGDPMAMARVREGLLLYHHARGEWTVARELSVENLRVFRAAGDQFRAAGAVEFLALIDQFLGRFTDARAELAEAGALFLAAGDLPNVVNVLVVGAATAISAGDAGAAARLCGAIAAHRDALGDIATPLEILRVPDPEQRARETLGDAAFEHEFTRGRGLLLEEAIQLAVRDPAGPTRAT
jgi:tetratricopeptide (TPR) repeat protein